MCGNKTALAALFAVIPLMGQPAAPEISAAQQPDLQALSAAVRSLRRTSAVSGEVKAKANTLISEAQAVGMNGEGRRRMSNAYVLLKGQAWDEKQQYAWSLALRPNATVADPALPMIAHLTQTYPASYVDTKGLKVRVSLLSGNLKAQIPLGTFDLPARDLIDRPFGFDAELTDKGDGEYVLRAEVRE